ncbi:unnamed protein product [Cuscuta europaea]|uniref:Late embryogenesis abundant protein LEA-2 subgroup domain-containing protein n=1 Tax=Cuscuta europaea TaxID=41803 RepID=A0A9P1E2K8_CUSEU|nr:unnamed protein product [Cuscuta europaea]
MSAKQNGTIAATPTAARAADPLKQPPRPYIPQRIHDVRHNRRRCSCRRCFCLGCFWAVLIICILLLLAAIAGAAFYVLFRPQRPEFSVSSLKISQFNLTTASDDTTRLTAKLNLTISARNPNKKMVYTYDRISLTAIASGIAIGNGSFPGFTSNPSNISVIHSTLWSMSQAVLDSDSVSELKSDLKKKKGGMAIKILMDTMVAVKQDKVKSRKVGIRVTCEGIHSQTPKGGGKKKTPAVATTSGASCKVDLRIKIWKWTF